jgi:hypothetical protein
MVNFTILSISIYSKNTPKKWSKWGGNHVKNMLMIWVSTHVHCVQYFGKGNFQTKKSFA